MKTISISVEKVTLSAELLDTPTAQKIWEALPFDGKVNLWGDEIYFEIPVELDEEPEATTDVEIGTLAYWPSDHAFCVFFGLTPVSTSRKPRAYSPVNVFGKVIGDAISLKEIPEQSPIRVTQA